jgi:type IV pilus biogenesis protein CpaD/CtpE
MKRTTLPVPPLAVLTVLALTALAGCESDHAAVSSEREREHERRVSEAWNQSDRPIRIPDSGVPRR